MSPTSCKKSGQKNTLTILCMSNKELEKSAPVQQDKQQQSPFCPWTCRAYRFVPLHCLFASHSHEESNTEDLHVLKAPVPRGNNVLLKTEEALQLLNSSEDILFDWKIINSMLSGEFWIILTAMSNVNPSRLMWFKASSCPPRKIKHHKIMPSRK